MEQEKAYSLLPNAAQYRIMLEQTLKPALKEFYEEIKKDFREAEENERGGTDKSN